MSQQGKQEWTEHTALGSDGIQCGGAGSCAANCDGLGFPSQKVQNAVSEGGVQT